MYLVLLKTHTLHLATSRQLLAIGVARPFINAVSLLDSWRPCAYSCKSCYLQLSATWRSYHSARPNTAMQPTCSVWPILALGGMSSAVASVIPVPLCRPRLMASRWAAPVWWYPFGGSNSKVPNSGERRQVLFGSGSGAGIRHDPVRCRVSAARRLGASEPPRVGWVPRVRYISVRCRVSAMFRLGAMCPPRVGSVPVNRREPVGAQQACGRSPTPRSSQPPCRAVFSIGTRYERFPGSDRPTRTGRRLNASR